MIVRLFGAPNVVEFHLDWDRKLIEPVEEGHFVWRTERPTFGARAVIAIDVNDQRVVELTQILEGLNYASNLIIRIGRVGGEDFHLTDEELFLFCAELVPRLQHVVGPGCQLGILRDYPKPLLVFEDTLT